MNLFYYASKIGVAGFLVVLLWVTPSGPRHPATVSNDLQQDQLLSQERLAGVDSRVRELEALHIEAHLAVMETKQDSDSTLLRGIATALILIALKDVWGFATKKRRTGDQPMCPRCNTTLPSQEPPEGTDR